MKEIMIGEGEYNKIYAALRLIENLYKQGLVKKHVFKNILDDYKDKINISEFECA